MEKNDLPVNSKAHSIHSLEELEERLKMGRWLDGCPSHNTCTTECATFCDCDSHCPVFFLNQSPTECSVHCITNCIVDCPSQGGPIEPIQRLFSIASKY